MNITDEYQPILDRMLRQTQERLAPMPVSAPCPHHPEVELARNDAASYREDRLVLNPCCKCGEAQARRREAVRLTRMGVHLELIEATLDNWPAIGETAKAKVQTVREFCRIRRGFLVMLGDLGTGKSHLAVGALRTFRTGMFIKQSELLRRLRQTYRDKAAVDPVDEAQDAGCLVLDELGLSPGGKDELPLLHDILDHRHGSYKPTILAGNLDFASLRDVIGERMMDRLSESAFAVLNFSGDSHRPEARARYYWEDKD